MSAFTKPLAQVRDYVSGEKLRTPQGREEALAALAQVERLATDMEKALRFYANEDDYLWHGDTRGTIQKNDRGAVARAVLSAREEGTA